MDKPGGDTLQRATEFPGRPGRWTFQRPSEDFALRLSNGTPDLPAPTGRAARAGAARRVGRPLRHQTELTWIAALPEPGGAQTLGFAWRSFALPLERRELSCWFLRGPCGRLDAVSKFKPSSSDRTTADELLDCSPTSALPVMTRTGWCIVLGGPDQSREANSSRRRFLSVTPA